MYKTQKQQKRINEMDGLYQQAAYVYILYVYLYISGSIEVPVSEMSKGIEVIAIAMAIAGNSRQ